MIYIFERSSGQLVGTIPSPAPNGFTFPKAIAGSADDRFLASAADANDGEVYLFDCP